MKNLFKLFGIIALVAVIGFSMISCEEEEEDSSTSTTSVGVNTQLIVRLKTYGAGTNTLNVKVTAQDGTVYEENNLAAGVEHTFDLSVGNFTLQASNPSQTHTAATTTFSIAAGRDTPIKYEYNWGGSWARY